MLARVMRLFQPFSTFPSNTRLVLYVRSQVFLAMFFDLNYDFLERDWESSQ